MTMILDHPSRPYGGMGYDSNMYPSMHAAPNFTDPWAHQTSNHAQNRSGLLQYSQIGHSPPTSAPSASNSQYAPHHHDGSHLLNHSHDIPRPSVSYADQQYSSSATAPSSYSTAYPSLSYAQSLHQQQAVQQRKMSEVSNDSRAATASFGELDASRGMLALSHQNLQDLTPRNIYEARAARSSSDSYGFPPNTSGHSSISAESGRSYPYYGSSVGSVADSATDYSSAASDAGYDPMSRTLPRPQQLMGAPLGPPAPQTMMGQFSSKVSGNTQKKHKCKVCDKRFTRPSSLQTHMYSHTGEKPFACDVEGCGRHFSVVSNLRRHKKVHRGEGASVSSASDAEDNASS
ncbi:hypothetical protein LTS08_004885 [Lithohypha guttulata]|uniref:uncharacterized protein n=1 Tax=Lithohypha guttulata TaxID=1690604 RepID=UPI002DDF43B7|nr:hypothetical protein LTS08_004885 [Lithohypha guttulata]